MTMLPTTVVHASPVQPSTVQTAAPGETLETTAAALANGRGQRVDPPNPTIADRPRLLVTHNSTPNTPSTTTMYAPDTSADCGTTVPKSKSLNQNSSTARMIVTGSDPDGGDLTMKFSLYDLRNERVSSLSVGPIAASGPDGVLFGTQIPSTWSDGSYYWTATLSDGSKSSEPSGRCYITLDSIAPLQPTVTSTSFDQGTLYPWDTASGSFTMAAAGATGFQYSWNGGSATTVPVNGKSRGVPAWTGVVALTAASVGALTVTALDAAGNRSPLSEAFVVKKRSEPAGAPGPVTNVTAIPASASIALSWTNPAEASLTGVMIRRSPGATPPASADAGTLVADVNKPAVSFTDDGLTSATQYSYAFFSHDGTPRYAAAASVTSTTTAVGPGALSGTVTDVGVIPQGLANARVNVQTPAGETLTATTAADGTYTVQGLSAGEYFVCFNGSDATSGASDTTGHVDECYDRQPPPNGDPTTPVVVTAGATTTGVNAALAAGGAVSGTVTKAGGASQDLANVRVIVSSGSLQASRSATTGADGSYTAKGLPAGTDYTVCFYGANATSGASDSSGYSDECWQNQPTSGTYTLVSVALGETTTGIDATLVAAGAISGTVTEAGAGQLGLANVYVYVYSSSGSGSATTAADGSYSVPGLVAANDYQVCFYASDAAGGSSDATGHVDQCYDNQPTSGTPTAVSVALGETTTGINASLARGGAISGTVTEAGVSQPGLGDVWVSVSSSSTGTYRSVSTAADGSYKVTGLPAATDYQVCFSASGATGGSSEGIVYVGQCFDNQPMSGWPTPVAVTAGADRSGVDASLAHGGAVSGTVTDASGTPQGLANVQVSVASPSSGAYGNTTTAADGSYTVTGLPDGTDYQVCFSASGATGGSSDATGYIAQCYDAQPTSGTPTPVTVTAGATTSNIDAALVGGGAISGRVTEVGARQSVLAYVNVSVSSPSSNGSGSAMTAADGSYTVTGLGTATDYLVCFSSSFAAGGSSDSTGYVDQCFDNQPTSGTPTPVAVAVGATTSDINAALVGAGAISGTVTEAGAGQPGLANVNVFLSSSSSGAYGSASTAADGTYTVKGLAAATDYEVCFSPAGATGGSSDATGYVNQCYDNQPNPGTPTPVAVTAGATTSDINAALVGAGAISGTVTDASGTPQGLANVQVSVFTSFGGTYGSATTEVDGSYTVTGLAAATDYQVCFSASGATGGSSDSTGYVDQCYDNEPTSGTPTPVAVTAGATTSVINAALSPAGAMVP